MLSTVYFEDSGVDLSRIGFGCASLMRIPSSRQRQNLLSAAFDAGIRHFDVARLYGLGRAEGEVGHFARRRRDELTIATKFGIEVAPVVRALARYQAPARTVLDRVPTLRRMVKRRDDAFEAPRCYGREVAQRHLDKSLRELGVDHVDILFVHDPGPRDDVRTDELLTFLIGARDAGKIRAWGVSQDAHLGVDIVERLGRSAVLQIRWDALSPAMSHQQRIVFGVLGSAHARISRALTEDLELRAQWSDSLQVDLSRYDELARLLLGAALSANSKGSVLFTTTQIERMTTATSILTDPPSAEVLDAFSRLCESLVRGKSQ